MYELHIYLFEISILLTYSYYPSNLIIICLYCVNQNQDSNKRMVYRLPVCNRPSMLVSLSLENGACWRVPNEFWTFNSSWISLNENTRRILNNNSRLFIFSLFIAFYRRIERSYIRHEKLLYYIKICRTVFFYNKNNLN